MTLRCTRSEKERSEPRGNEELLRSLPRGAMTDYISKTNAEVEVELSVNVGVEEVPSSERKVEPRAASSCRVKHRDVQAAVGLVTARGQSGCA